VRGRVALLDPPVVPPRDHRAVLDRRGADRHAALGEALLGLLDRGVHELAVGVRRGGAAPPPVALLGHGPVLRLPSRREHPRPPLAS
jgi:hypothetical protein